MTNETRQNLKTLIVGTLGFMLFWCTLALIATNSGCGGVQGPIEAPVLEKARISGEVELDVSWYGVTLDIDCAGQAQAGEEGEGAEGECCVQLAIWRQCWDETSGRVVVQ